MAGQPTGVLANQRGQRGAPRRCAGVDQLTPYPIEHVGVHAAIPIAAGTMRIASHSAASSVRPQQRSRLAGLDRDPHSHLVGQLADERTGPALARRLRSARRPERPGRRRGASAPSTRASRRPDGQRSRLAARPARRGAGRRRQRSRRPERPWGSGRGRARSCLRHVRRLTQPPGQPRVSARWGLRRRPLRRRRRPWEARSAERAATTGRRASRDLAIVRRRRARRRVPRLHPRRAGPDRSARTDRVLRQ